MYIISEKSKMPNPESEDVLTSEKNEAESLVSEKDFGVRIEQAGAEVDDSQAMVVAKAEKTISNISASSELPEGKALSVYQEGGFSKRVVEVEGQIAELGAQTKAEIGDLSQDSGDLKDFTKRYSGFWREQLAHKVSEARANFYQKKNSIQQENEKRGKTRAELEAEVKALEDEIVRIQAELETKKIKLEEEKGKISYRIASLFGKDKETPLGGSLKESETELEKLKREADDKRKLLDECKEIVLDDNELKGARDEIGKFYQEQQGVKEVFEGEKNKERDIGLASREKGILFLHTLAIDSVRSSADTSQHNPNFDTRKMTGIDKARVVMGVEPTISVSTIDLSGKDKENGFRTIFPIGLIIGGGTMLSAYGSDAGTRADSLLVRRSQSDRNLKSIVQENFSENIGKALEGAALEGASQKGFNEIVVENPKVAGISLDLNRLSYDESAALAGIKQALVMGREFGMPVYDINPSGRMIDITSEDMRTVTQEDILSNKCNLTAEDRIKGVEEVLKTQGQANPEIQNRLAEISKKEKLDQDFSEAQKQKELYSARAEECLQALEYERLARFVGKLEDTSFEGISKAVLDNSFFAATEESTMANLNLMFKGKSPEEAKDYSQKVVKRADMIKGLINKQ